MGLFGLDIEQIYLYGLIFAGVLTMFYVFFADVTDAGDVMPLLNPAVILAFVTLAAASGYFLEILTTWQSGFILLISVIVAVLLDTLLYFFVLIPLSSAEASIAYTDESLPGQVAKVIIPIPVDGYGEVVIETYGGMISKRATGYDNESIEQEKQVLIIEVKDGTLYVREYEPLDFNKREK
ncbi:MAG TPA: hypothetical protein VK947_04775 [Planococcus sp. (in: firmicutes)]|nr:hypothetical protein [Planococcus sp. (in: firmicutes)]